MERSNRWRSSSRSSGWRSSAGSRSIVANARSLALADQRHVLGQPRQPQVWHTRLLRVEQCALSAQAQVLVGEIEPVGGADHRVDASPRLLVLLVGFVEQDARAGMFAPADTPPELVQLREPEPFRVLDEHHGGVRHVDPDLDHRGGDQQVGSSRAEALHDLVLVLRTHPTVQELDAQVGEHLGRETVGLGLGGLHLRPVAFVDRGTHDEGLPAGPHLLPDEVVGRRTLGGRADRARGDRPSALRELVEHHHVEVAVVRERERPRDRGRGHDQHVGLAALALQRRALVQAEPVLLVDHGETQVGERHRLLHEGVGADDEVDAAVGDGVDDPLSILARDRGAQQREGDRRLLVAVPGRGILDAVEERPLARRRRRGPRGSELEVRNAPRCRRAAPAPIGGAGPRAPRSGP